MLQGGRRHRAKRLYGKIMNTGSQGLVPRALGMKLPHHGVLPGGAQKDRVIAWGPAFQGRPGY